LQIQLEKFYKSKKEAEMKNNANSAVTKAKSVQNIVKKMVFSYNKN
jgi:hypothetical protein